MGFGDCRGCRTGARGRMGLHRPHRLSRRGGTQTRHRQSQGGAFRRSSRRSLHAGGLSDAARQLEQKRILREPGRVPPRHRRSASRGIPQDRGCGGRPPIDDPQLASRYVLRPDLDLEECRKRAALSVELLNHALEGIPAERVRYHTCYSINIGPRVHDLELKHIVDVMLRVNAGAYSFEAANPRHEREWRVWENVKLPEGKLLIPGIIAHSSNLVEHPELVAERIVRFAGVAGRENVIAGADCGFASSATTCEVHPSVVWAKLAALAEGARFATRHLW